MAIRHWSGRRLVGTWIAGVAGEVVLLALPVAFVTVTVFGGFARESFVGSRSVGEARIEHVSAVQERAARSAAVAARAAEAEARIAEAEAKIAAVRAAEAGEARAQFRRSERRAADVVPPVPPTTAAFSRPIGEVRSAQALEAPAWYAIPMAGAVALYVLAIPLGLLAITFVWMIARFAGYRPPPSAA
jgi:hypothetical protein